MAGEPDWCGHDFEGGKDSPQNSSAPSYAIKLTCEEN